MLQTPPICLPPETTSVAFERPYPDTRAPNPAHSLAQLPPVAVALVLIHKARGPPGALRERHPRLTTHRHEFGRLRPGRRGLLLLHQLVRLGVRPVEEAARHALHRGAEGGVVLLEDDGQELPRGWAAEEQVLAPPLVRALEEGVLEETAAGVVQVAVETKGLRISQKLRLEKWA
jgi:hypothetical protein